MYTILVNNDNTLTKSVTTHIMHRSSMVDGLHILVEPTYQNSTEAFDMRTFTCLMEYRLPVSETYVTEILTPSTELYKERLEYTLPINTKITSEVGNVELKFTFTRLDILEDGTKVERVRKTSSTTMTILPVSTWSDYIADAKLDPIVQMLLETQSQQNQLLATAEALNANKADNIKLDTENNELYLESEGKQIGDRIDLSTLGDELVESTDDGMIKVII